ncbi:MAG TPA: glycosyltransferase [Planctomycetota bacterium]|nr:glycosyltransferase [Planctomycetota bacterium]
MAATGPTPPPEFSIVVVTCQRPVDLAHCLLQLRSHLDGAGMPAAEVLTVHAPGDQASIAMVQNDHPWVRVLCAPVRRLTTQRNLGARAANGTIVVYLDDDAWPQAGWLTAFAAAFQDPQVLAVSGQVFRRDGTRQYGRMAVTALGRPFALADAAPAPAVLSPTLPGCCLAIRRSALFSIGGFDERLSIHFDDVDCCRRLWLFAGQRPGALHHEPAVRAFHEPAPGPYRRTLYDRAWYVVARDSIYFALRHGRATPLRALLVAGMLQVPKTARFCGWMLRGKLSPIALLRCLVKQFAGIAAGYLKGLCQRPLLPLLPLPAAQRLAEQPATATATATTEPEHAGADR